MEREVVLKDTRTQRVHKFTSEATTWGQLKEKLDELHIDYTGLEAMEALSNTKFVNDDSILPTNLKYKGEDTNKLFILLLQTKSKVALGEGTRKEAYAKIRVLGLEEEVREAFGCNYTNVATSKLWEVIDKAIAESEEDNEEEGDNEDETVDAYENVDILSKTIAIHLTALVNALINIGAVDPEQLKPLVQSIANHLQKAEKVVTTIGGQHLTEKDIDEIFNVEL